MTMDEPMSGTAPETEPQVAPAVGPRTPPEEPGKPEDEVRRERARRDETGREHPVGDGGHRPLEVHVTPTGHPGIDAQLRRLADADHLAVSGHLAVYEDVHRGLRDTLTALDRRPGPPVPGAPHNPGS